VSSCKNRNKPLWEAKNFLTVLLLTSQEGLYSMSDGKHSSTLTTSETVAS
jgi:hypothetical protein